jgi:hypothetical protein
MLYFEVNRAWNRIIISIPEVASIAYAASTHAQANNTSSSAAAKNMTSAAAANSMSGAAGNITRVM